jgi:hypothetical protein
MLPLGVRFYIVDGAPGGGDHNCWSKVVAGSAGDWKLRWRGRGWGLPLIEAGLRLHGRRWREVCTDISCQWGSILDRLAVILHGVLLPLLVLVLVLVLVLALLLLVRLCGFYVRISSDIHLLILPWEPGFPVLTLLYLLLRAWPIRYVQETGYRG